MWTRRSQEERRGKLLLKFQASNIPDGVKGLASRFLQSRLEAVAAPFLVSICLYRADIALADELHRESDRRTFGCPRKTATTTKIYKAKAKKEVIRTCR